MKKKQDRKKVKREIHRALLEARKALYQNDEDKAKEIVQQTMRMVAPDFFHKYRLGKHGELLEALNFLEKQLLPEGVNEYHLNNSKVKIIIFDLDGTLTDPKEGIINSFKYALEKYGLEGHRKDALGKLIGPPLHQAFQEHLSIDEKEAFILVEYFREYFRERGIYENRLYSGVPEMLDQLLQHGYLLALATSKAEVFARRVLEYFQLKPYFKEVAGSNLDGSRSAKGEIIAEILSRDSIKQEVHLEEAYLHNNYTTGAIMVGDRKYDVWGARQNKLPSVGVTYGYGGKTELQEAGATHLVDSVEELKSFLYYLGCSYPPSDG